MFAVCSKKGPKMLRHSGFLAVVLPPLVAVGCAFLVAEASAKPVNDIAVKDAKIVVTGIGPGAGYMTFINRSKKADKLVGAKSASASKVMIHETVEEDGVLKMRHAKTFDVPASGKLVLKPGGRHLMLMGLGPKIKPGTKLVLELQFQNAGPVKVTVPVLSPAQAHANEPEAR
jgi:hypothetical protein